MKIALFGKTGQVATELQRRAPAEVSVEAIPRLCADFTNPEVVRAAAWGVEADVIVNAVAYTAVDRAESEPKTARQINAASVSAMAEAAAERGIPLLHLSTDYVFDGSGDQPRTPDDPAGPINVYGQTKLEGEEALRATGARHVILRTSWVFSAHGANFVKTMLRLAGENDRLTIVADQVGGPTPAAAIADACLAIADALAEGHEGGTHHFSGAPDVSWADFAREIFRQAGLDRQVEDIATESFPTPAPRPRNSRLDCASLDDGFGIRRPDWRQGLAEVLKDLNA